MLEGRTVFGNFLRSEFSEENIDFWVACEDYKKCSPSELVTRAKQLYQQYVEADAPNEVRTFLWNISGQSVSLVTNVWATYSHKSVTVSVLSQKGFYIEVLKKQKKMKKNVKKIEKMLTYIHFEGITLNRINATA